MLETVLTIGQALAQGARLLEEAAVPSARLTAEILLCHALRKERPHLFSHGTDPLTELAWLHYGRYLHQRLQGEPVQYITKRQEFYGRLFRVGPAVLIPRPETEHVIEVALECAPRARRAVDIGCGSGAIGVTWALERPGCAVWASDISEAAVRVARENADALGAVARFAVCDLGAAFGPEGCFDLVLSNPPYIPQPEGPALQREIREHEPHVALFGGPTGVEIYERLIADARRLLAPGGWLIMEIGYQGEGRVRAMLDPVDWDRAGTRLDLAGWPRVVAAQRRG